MREIKFRAWYKGKMINNLNPIEMRLENTSECTIMQYTGLKDKNGLEIYEGDVIMTTRGKETVTWNEWQEKNGDYGSWIDSGWLIDSMTTNDIEIIGNLYDKPELLDNK